MIGVVSAEELADLVQPHQFLHIISLLRVADEDAQRYVNRSLQVRVNLQVGARLNLLIDGVHTPPLPSDVPRSSEESQPEGRVRRFERRLGFGRWYGLW